MIRFRAALRRPVLFRSVLLVSIGVHLVQAPPFLSAQLFERESSDDGPDISYDPGRPVPYDPDELPQWARDLRRGEIIAIGAFPLSMVITGLVYELGRFAYYSIRAGAPVGEYAPWFFSTSAEGAFTNEERTGLVLTSVFLSTGIAVIDYLLGRRERTDGDE